MLNPSHIGIHVCPDPSIDSGLVATIHIAGVGSIIARYFTLSDSEMRDGCGGNCEVQVLGNVLQSRDKDAKLATFVTALLMAGVDINTDQFKWALLNALDLLGR